MTTFLTVGAIVLFLIAAIASGANESNPPVTVTISSSPNPSVSFGNVMLAMMSIAGMIALLVTLTG